jgi:adenylate kinase family enzyme
MTKGPFETGGPFFPDWHHVGRVLVTGANGAGKTVLARQISCESGLPVYHKDAMALTKHWQLAPASARDAALCAVVSQPRWIIEGGPSILIQESLDRADAVIWIDLPAWLRLCRIVLRSWQYLGRTRPELPAGNTEWPGLRQVKFAAKAYFRHAGYQRTVTDRLTGTHVCVVHLTRRAEVRQCLASVKAAGQRAERL